MPRKSVLFLQDEHRLRDAMRRAPRMTALIWSDVDGILVELSDGRQCCVRHELSPVTGVGIAAAIGWARRHGATDVKILD